MPPVVHRFDPPERFVAGTVGEPGQRTFFLQARDGTRVTSVSLEKEQVEILAQRVNELLDELTGVGGVASEIPQQPAPDDLDTAPLEQPIQAEFRAGTITLSWDGSDERVVIEVFPVSDQPAPIETDEEELLSLPIAEPEPDEVFIVRLTPGLARAFAARARRTAASRHLRLSARRSSRRDRPADAAGDDELHQFGLAAEEGRLPDFIQAGCADPRFDRRKGNGKTGRAADRRRRLLQSLEDRDGARC